MCVWRYILPLLLLADLVEAAEPVTCWGLSDEGQASTVAFLTALGDVATVDLGYKHGCALRTVGEVVCWGSDSHGQSTVPAGLTDIAGVVAGSYHSCVWTYAGTVQCWGNNDHGQTDVPSGLGHVLGVAAGWNSVCTWNTAATATCWGENRAGELTIPAGLTDIQGVALGQGRHACAHDSAGIGTCWGANENGQSSVNQPNKNGFVQMSVGSNHSCGLRMNGKARCWGASDLQQLNIPGFFGNGLNMDSGYTHNCGGRNGIMCWGDETYGESVVPSHLATGPPMWISAFDKTTCAYEKLVTTSTVTTTETQTPGAATQTVTTETETTTATTATQTTTTETITTQTDTTTFTSVTNTITTNTITTTLTSVTGTTTTTATTSSTLTDTTATITTTVTTVTQTTTSVTSTTTATATTVSSTTTLTATTVTATVTTLTTTDTSTTTVTGTTVTSTTTVTGSTMTATGTTITATTATGSTITATTTTTVSLTTVSTTTTISATTVTDTVTTMTATLTTVTDTVTTATATSMTLTVSSTLTTATATSTTTLTATTATVTGTTVTATDTSTTSLTDTTVTDTQTTQTYTGSSTATTITTATDTDTSTTTLTATSVTTTTVTGTTATDTETSTTSVSSTTATSVTESSTTTASTSSTTTNTLSTTTLTTTTLTTNTLTGTTATTTATTATATTVSTVTDTISSTVSTVTVSTVTATTTSSTLSITTSSNTQTTLTTSATTVTVSTSTTSTMTATTRTGTTSTNTSTTFTSTDSSTVTTLTTATFTSTTSATATSTTSTSATATFTTSTSTTSTATATGTHTSSTTTSTFTHTGTITTTTTTTASSTSTASTTTHTHTGTHTSSSTTTTTSTMTATVSTTSTTTVSTSSITTTETELVDATFFVRVEADVHNASRGLVQQARVEPGRWVQQTWVGLSEAVSIKPENLTVDGSFVNIGNAALAPVELLRKYVADGDDVVVVVTRVSNPSYLIQKVIDNGEDLGEIHGMVEVTLYNRRTGQTIDTDEKLDHGILIKVSDDPGPAGRTDGACVFVEDNTWSTEGMRKANGEELDTSSQNAQYRGAQLDLDNMQYVGHDERLTTDGLWCTTENFGINAFLLGPHLECASAIVSTQRDVEGGEEDHPWITSRPALLYFALLLFLVCCHVYTLHADRKYKMMDTWSDRRLDTLITQLTPEVQFNNNKMPESPEKRIAPFYPYVTMALLIRCRLVTERHSVPLKGLPSELLRSSFGPWGYNRRCWIFFRAFHPLVTLGDPPFMLSCVKNAKLMTDSILFPLCVLCLVFSATGDLLQAGSDPGCVPRSFAAGAAFVLTGFFAFLCGLPCRFQACCFARRDPEQRPSCKNNTCFWVLELIWTLLHLVITLIYLSNVAPVDRWKWEVLLVFVLLFVFLLKPLVIALFLALWTGIVVRLWPELLQDPTPTPEPAGNAGNRTGNDELAGLNEVQRETVKNLAHRGISLAHLLDFYQKLGTVVMPQFDPQVATTEDVVRQAIIPLSRGDMGDVYGQPLKVKLGILRLVEHPGRACDVFVRCEVLNRPQGVLETWAVPTVGLRQVDWCMEAELLGYQPGDSLELALIEADTNRKLCSGRLRSRVLAGQHEVPLISNSDLRLGTIILQITPPVTAAPPRVPRAPVAPPAYQSQGYLEWCGVADLTEHPAIPELGWVMPNCGRPDTRPCKVQLGDVEISLARAAGNNLFDEESNARQRSRNVQGTSYASAVNVPILPGKMVTHHWGNSFTHLMAVVFADALGQETYGQLLPMLQARDTAKLRSLLGAAGKLDKSYWIDAFSVNQHMSVCSNPLQLVDSMGMRISPCTCATPKIAAGPVCENDKMPHMMAYLNGLWAERGAEFAHVVAIDPAHAVFGRTWCIAELHEAYQANMPQIFVLHSFDDLDAQATRSVVDGIDIRTSKTSCEEDKKHLLNEIDDVDAYNERVRNLVNYRLKNTNAVPAEKISLTTWLLDALLI